MTMGPAPMIRIERMSVRLGIGAPRARVRSRPSGGRGEGSADAGVVEAGTGGARGDGGRGRSRASGRFHCPASCGIARVRAKRGGRMLRIWVVACGLAAMGGAAAAAPVTFEMAGNCALGCRAGTAIAGAVSFYRAPGPGSAINSGEFTGLSFAVDGGPRQEMSFYSASGIWGTAADTIALVAFDASDVVAPDAGWAMSATLTQTAGGGLAGQLVYFLGGACVAVTCEGITTPGRQSHFEVALTPSTGTPAPVPLPPALGLALAGTAALAGVSRLRRRRG